jgi:hypothetical protein
MSESNNIIQIQDSFIVNFNSKNGYQKNGSFMSDIVFQTKNILPNNTNVIYNECCVQNLTVPISWYIINEYNNILNYTVDTVPFSIFINYGNYNGQSLIELLQTLFLNNGQTMTILLSQTTGVLTFIISSGIFVFLSSSSCREILGFTSTLSSASNQIKMTYPLNLLGSQKLCVYSSALVNHNSDPYGNIILTVPINQTQNSMLSYENKSGHSFILGIDNVQQIDISLKNEQGQFLDLNNIPFSITLKFTRHRYLEHDKKTLLDVLQN